MNEHEEDLEERIKQARYGYLSGRRPFGTLMDCHKDLLDHQLEKMDKLHKRLVKELKLEKGG